MVKGWHQESRRHSLAAKGIKTDPKIKEIQLWHKKWMKSRRDGFISEHLDRSGNLNGYEDDDMNYIRNEASYIASIVGTSSRKVSEVLKGEDDPQFD